MQINQPFEFGLGILFVATGLLGVWVGLSRIRHPLPRIRGWWFVAEGPAFALFGLARISAAFDFPRHPSGRTLFADGAAVLVGAVVLSLILPSARAVWKASRQKRDNPAA